MRNRSAVLASFGLIVFMAAVADAAPPSPAPPGVKPPVVVPPSSILKPPHITSVKPASRAYTDGPLALEVEVKNPGTTALETNLLLDRMKFTVRDGTQAVGRAGTVALRVPAGGTATVTIADGFDRSFDGCRTTFDRVMIEGGTSVFVKIQPTCTFVSKMIDPNEGQAPDRVASQRAGKVSYEEPVLRTRNPSCSTNATSTLGFKATVNNRSAARATNVRLKVLGPDGGPSQDLGPFELAPGAQKADVLVNGPWGYTTGRWQLGVEATGASVWQPGIKVEITRLCSIAVEITPSVGYNINPFLKVEYEKDER